MNESNTALLSSVAAKLGDLCDRPVFVGGCATALLVTDPAAPAVRVTQDVDALVAITSLSDYHRMGHDLLERGFTLSLVRGDPPYRFRSGSLTLDLMPVDASILGFSSRWYAQALDSAVPVQLPGGPSIRIVTPACFLATKLEAFEDRGGGDYLTSHDLEDVLSVVDGRPQIVAEVADADLALRRYVAEVLGRLLADEAFVNALPGLVPEGSPAGRAALVVERLRAIVALGSP